MSGGTHEEDDEATRRLETAGPMTVAVQPDAEHFAPGTLIGHYRIDSLIGVGGMGSVYRAEQLEPVRRTVALKVVRGRMDIRRRAFFEIERQTLAQMHHPGIAQIYDAGATAEGVFWFAMEYIEGEPVTAIARDLDLDARLALMARVCDAVQHAHQKGIVHRDLKPANILVTQVDGHWLPKIIDFGIATATARAGSAASGGSDTVRAGTLHYMSPEQLDTRAVAIDTRSDVYALGLVLFELITGQRAQGAHTGRTASLLSPSSAASHPAAAETSTLRIGLKNRRLHELDRIVATATAHERDQRYPSVNALADDLRRFTQNQPLRVMPATPLYLIGTFARRHRLLLALASAFVAALALGLAFSLYGFSQARAQREVAHAKQRDLEQVVAFQQNMLGGIDVMAMGASLVAREREQLARFGDAGLLADFETVAARLDAPSLARTVLVESVLERAETTLAERFADQPELAAGLRQSVAQVYHAIGQYDAAVDAFDAVVAQRTATLGQNHSDTLKSRIDLVNALERKGDYARAETLARQVVEQASLLPESDALQHSASMSLAQVLRSKSDHRNALKYYEQAMRFAERNFPPDDPQALRVRQNYALALHLGGDTPSAKTQFEQVLAIQRRLGPSAENNLVATLVNYATLLAESGDIQSALALEQEAYEEHKRRLGNDHPLTLLIRNNMGVSLLDLDRAQDALTALGEAAEGRARVQGAQHPLTLRSLASKARALDGVGRSEEALALYDQVIEARKRILGKSHRDTLRVSISRNALLARLGHPAQAAADARQTHADAVAGLGEDSSEAIDTLLSLASLEARAGQGEAARARLAARLASLEAAMGEELPPSAYWVALDLFMQLREAGLHDQAGAVRERLFAPLLGRNPDELPRQLSGIRRRIEAALAP